MNMKEMRTAIMTAIEQNLPEGVHLDTINIVKLNDLQLTGIVFQKDDFGATFYVEDFNNGTKSPTDIANEMLAAYETAIIDPPAALINDFRNIQKLEDIQDNLIVTLVDLERNHEYLKEIPYRSIGSGLAFICRVFRADSTDMMATTVTTNLAESNHWNLEEMFDLAIKNTLEVNPPKLYHMHDAIFGQPVDDLFMNNTKIESNDILILTNVSGLFGAVSLFLPGMVDSLLRRIGQPFYAIPSSQHEYLLIPETSGLTPLALKSMCKDANASIVALKDILSDSILYVSAKEIVVY